MGRARMDLSGQRYGRLLVLAEVDPPGDFKHETRWFLCRCDCGKEISVRMNQLRTGKTTSCGCFQREKSSASNSYDLTGKKFGRLTVIKRVGSSGDDGLWECICVCGQTVQVITHSLVKNKTKSCGCWRSDHGVKMQRYMEDNLRVDGVMVPALKRKKGKNNSTGVKGVSRFKDKYKASIMVNGKSYYLGIFPTIAEAAKARQDAENKYHKPYLEALEKERETSQDSSKRKKEKTDITGQQFGRWVVIKEIRKDDVKGEKTWCLCRCECGTEREVRRSSLVSKQSKSCGCLQKESVKKGMRVWKTEKNMPKVDGIDIKNFRNKPKSNSKTGHKGVSPFEGKYRAQIGFNGEVIYLGLYETLDEAIQARQKAEKKYYTPLLKKAEEEGIKLKKSCEECGTKFLPKTDSQRFCKDTCRYRNHARNKRKARVEKGDCPQCGKEWIEPIETHLGKPKHCRRCQEYYADRNKS